MICSVRPRYRFPVESLASRNTLQPRISMLLVLCLSVHPACDPTAGREPELVERDSAGIRIVESTSPVWGESQAWRLSTTPALQIGSESGAPEVQFFRVQAIRRFDDGRILVVNAGTNDLRIYSPSGEHIRTIGREGSGPGEFRYPRDVWIIDADSLVVVDLDRASIFDSTGTFVRTEPFGVVHPRGRFEDGTYLRVVFAAGQDVFALGYSRPRVALLRTSLDGASTDTILDLPGDETYRISPDGSFIASYVAPFGLRRSIALYRNDIYTGDGAALEVAHYHHSGTLSRIMRGSANALRVDSDTIAAFEQATLNAAGNEVQRGRFHQLFREWTYPSVQPVYDQLLVDQVSNVWVRAFAVTAPDPSQWTVFDSSGRWLGHVSIPRQLLVKEIGDTYVLGLWTDTLGVEYVRLYTLHK